MENCYTYNQIANKNLHNLRRQTRPFRKQALQDMDQEMPQRRRDERAVSCHLGHAGVEVVAVFAAIAGDEGGKDFLETGERAGGQHLGA